MMKRGLSPSSNDRIGASFKRVCSVKKAHFALREEADRILHEIEELQCQYKACLDKVDDLKHGPFEDAVVDFSESWTLKFVAKMRTRLPRELRDSVYEHFWKGLPSHELDHTLDLLVLEGPPRCYKRPCLCLRDARVPHILNPAYVGLDMALEAAGNLYRNNSSSITRDLGIEEICKLLGRDVFHIGFNPTTAVKRASVVFHPNEHVTMGEDGQLSISPTGCETNTPDGFKLLLRINWKPNFPLRIVMRQRMLSYRMLEKTLEFLKPVFHALEKREVDVQVVHAYDVNLKSGGQEIHSLNEWFKIPSVEFKKQHIKVLDETEFIRDHHRLYRLEDGPDSNESHPLTLYRQLLNEYEKGELDEGDDSESDIMGHFEEYNSDEMLHAEDDLDSDDLDNLWDNGVGGFFDNDNDMTGRLFNPDEWFRMG